MIAASITLAATAHAATAEEIHCEGEYGGHLQGIATDEAGHIYWSFTVDLVKTDATGKVLHAIEVVSHHGDLTYHDGKVYVATNLGKFNEEPGQEDSWVYIYEAESLEFIEKKPVPELVHGAGGMGYHDGHFFVVGGLPHHYTENYVYEYTMDFVFVKRHTVDSGHTNLGIQTTCYLDGSWWFGCYEKERGLLQSDEAFNYLDRYDPSHAYGIAPWKDGKWLRGESGRAESKRWIGHAVVESPIVK